jgi:hypothetical protein
MAAIIAVAAQCAAGLGGVAARSVDAGSDRYVARAWRALADFRGRSATGILILILRRLLLVRWLPVGIAVLVVDAFTAVE